MADSVLGRAALNGGFQHFSVGFTNQSDRSEISLSAVLMDKGEKFLPSFLTGTGCATDTVEILRKLSWHIVIDDRFDTLDIETARS